MTRAVPLLLLLSSAQLLFCSSALADQAPGPKPVEAQIEFPSSAEPVTPPPGSKGKLTAGVVYDIRAKIPCAVRAYPAALVTIAKEVVPAGETLRVKDAFSDGAKSHVYKGPVTVYTVRAAGTGTVELVVTPLGLKSEAEIVTVALEVDAGQGPIPPPKPKPDDSKPVDPVKPAEVTSFHVIMIYESGATLPAAQVGALYGEAVETYLTAKCTGGRQGWDRRDKDKNPATDLTPLKDVWVAVKPKVNPTDPPCLAIEVNGRVSIESLPATEAATLDLLKKYRGEK